MTFDCLHFSNPNPNFPVLPSKKLRPSSSSSMASSFCFSPTASPFRRKTFSIAGVSPLPPLKSVARLSFRYVHRRNNLSVVSFAAAHEDSKPSEGDTEMEKDNLDQAGKASQETWEQVLASFKEQALKLQSVSHEAYEESVVVLKETAEAVKIDAEQARQDIFVVLKETAEALKETAEVLKIEAEQARQDIFVVFKETAEVLKIRAEQGRQNIFVLAQELGEDSRQYLTVAAENSPEPVKDVVETFASAEDLNDVSKVRDFYIGIPYGTVLSAGGFLNFMLTGSISALRFGVILGGILLALSVSSLQSWKKGQSTEMTLKGQAAIAGILSLRDIGLLFQGLTLVGLLKAALSVSVAAFFAYRVIYGSRHSRPSVDGEANT